MMRGRDATRMPWTDRTSESGVGVRYETSSCRERGPCSVWYFARERVTVPVSFRAATSSSVMPIGTLRWIRDSKLILCGASKSKSSERRLGSEASSKAVPPFSTSGVSPIPFRIDRISRSWASSLGVKSRSCSAIEAPCLFALRWKHVVFLVWGEMAECLCQQVENLLLVAVAWHPVVQGHEIGLIAAHHRCQHEISAGARVACGVGERALMRNAQLIERGSAVIDPSIPEDRGRIRWAPNAGDERAGTLLPLPKERLLHVPVARSRWRRQVERGHATEVAAPRGSRHRDRGKRGVHHRSPPSCCD